MFFILLLMLIGTSFVSANDGVYFANGSQLVPIRETDISVSREVLTISLCDDGFARVEVDQDRCDHCGKCTSFCRMDIRQVGDHECIQCGECRAVCPQEAIYRSMQSIQKTIGET